MSFFGITSASSARILTGNIPSIPPLTNASNIIVELGQSNMEGRAGDEANPSYPFTTTNGFYWNGTSQVSLSTTRGGATKGSHANYFAEKFFTLSGRKPIMVEAAQGSTGLTSTSSATNWSGSSSLRGSAESLTNGALTSEGTTAPLCALWCQGESDGGEMYNNPSYTKAIVKTAMQSVIDWWFALYPNSPFIISAIGYSTGTVEAQPFYDIMRDIQYEVATENTLVYIGFERAKFFKDEGKLIDTVHYSYEGNKEMGEALATKLNSLL